MPYTQRAVVWVEIVGSNKAVVAKSITDGRTSDEGGVTFPQASEQRRDITDFFADKWKIVSAQPNGNGAMLVLERVVGAEE